MKIYCEAMRRLPEFTGLKGRTYPGQDPPLQPCLTPRRPDLPQGFSHDWRKIGSKRHKQTVTILVTPAEEDTLRPPKEMIIHSTDFYPALID